MTALDTAAPARETSPVPTGPARRTRTARQGGHWLPRLLINVFLWGYAAVAIGPLLLMVNNSLRTQQQIATEPLGLPVPVSFTSFQEAWVTASFETYFVNSIVVTVTSVALSTFVSLLAAYAFARTRVKGLRSVESVFLAGLMLPVHLAVLPLFFMLDQLHMTSNIASLVLVYTALGIPFSTFVLAVFFRQLPVELEEAARLDGAGPFRAFWSVMLPLVKPALATVVVFRFVPVWNDFFYPLILMRDRDSYTLPVGLTRFFGEYSTDWPQLFAGLTIATLPLVLVFLVATRQIISGLTAGMSK
ncbi:carbohydrate ABC transporter permease [Cellulosimicrobium marinum]|uniref:carbohydrate ABC transporter permease n=1 Tax=Cellulosimicrobium marinum TaxID=1638992 RepID=UPI001E440F46|nr:carbohydrate ABC transporter permease [Cellulosimicrobium marinum]MCB7137125.1 carbohydrate ABC transporter permease [Cellulosimicrobium marinum]